MSDEKSFDLGDRISVVPTVNELPHPQGDFNPWASAQAAETPFEGQADPAPKQDGPGLQVGYDPAAATAPTTTVNKAATSTATAPPRGKRPLPADTKVTRKETTLLTRFREVFGLQRVAVQTGHIKRRDPADLNSNISLEFGLRGLNYEDYQWVMEKAEDLRHSEKMVALSWKIAVCSMGVASFEGSPIWDVLGFEPESQDSVRDPMYPDIGLRFRAAEAFCDELQGSLFDTIEHLYSLYEEKIDSKYFPKVEEEPLPEEGPTAPLAQNESNS